MSDPEAAAGETKPLTAAGEAAATAKKSLGAVFGKEFGIVLGLAFAVFIVVIGVIHREHCPLEPNLGYVLMAAGGLSILIAILDSFKVAREAAVEDSTAAKVAGWLATLSMVLKMVVFGYLVYIMWSLYPVVDYENTTDGHFCHKTMVYTAFLSLGVTLLMLLITVVGLCMSLCGK